MSNTAWLQVLKKCGVADIVSFNTVCYKEAFKMVEVGFPVSNLGGEQFDMALGCHAHSDLALGTLSDFSLVGWIIPEGLVFNYKDKKEKIDSALKVKMFLETQQKPVNNTAEEQDIEEKSSTHGSGDLEATAISDMKKDIDALIAEERAEIIGKYEKGRKEGAQIDPWEDADFTLYKVTDRFGFLHEHELPLRSALEEKQKLQEIERVDKWLKMLRKWGKYRNSEKMFRRVYKGIPLQVRGQVWSLLLDIEKIKAENEGKYEKMKEQAKSFSSEIKQIDLDVNRTFRNHIMFRDRYGV
ncbi:PREDICTED: USP6 N-terminal-like protein, partial [Gekko japonicus]|uniref:USP6 N-terminal-like protein n=1 Tax=Gekko japonicus TaxID=146911 RepID=A0ABM1LFD1_GEKJA